MHRICEEADASALRWLLRGAASSGARLDTTLALESVVAAAMHAKRWQTTLHRVRTGTGLLAVKGEGGALYSAGAEGMGVGWAAVAGAADASRLAQHRLPQLSPDSMTAALSRASVEFRKQQG